MQTQLDKSKKYLTEIQALSTTFPKDSMSRMSLCAGDNVGRRLLNMIEEYNENVRVFRKGHVSMCMKTMKTFLLEVSSQVTEVNSQLTRVGSACLALQKRLTQIERNRIEFINEQLRNAKTTINTIQSHIYTWSTQLQQKGDPIPDYVLLWLSLTFNDDTEKHTNIAQVMSRLRNTRKRIRYLLVESKKHNPTSLEFETSVNEALNPVAMGFSVGHENNTPMDDDASVSTGSLVRDQYGEFTSTISKLQFELEKLGLESVSMWGNPNMSFSELNELSKKIETIKQITQKKLEDTHQQIQQLDIGKATVENQIMMTLRHLNVIIGTTINAYQKYTESYSTLYALMEDVNSKVVGEFTDGLHDSEQKLDVLDKMQIHNLDDAYNKEGEINSHMKILSNKLIEVMREAEVKSTPRVSGLLQYLIISIKSYASHKNLWDSIEHIESLAEKSKQMIELFLDFESRIVT
jgi:DNA-binding transcriptional MerR regulator